MKVPFKAYLHDDYTSAELAEEIFDQMNAQGIDLGMDEEELMEKIGKPFYEVTLNCMLDTETGAVTLVSAHL